MLKAEEEGKEHKEWVGKCAHASYFSSELPNVLLLEGGLKAAPLGGGFTAKCLYREGGLGAKFTDKQNPPT